MSTRQPSLRGTRPKSHWHLRIGDHFAALFTRSAEEKTPLTGVTGPPLEDDRGCVGAHQPQPHWKLQISVHRLKQLLIHIKDVALTTSLLLTLPHFE